MDSLKCDDPNFYDELNRVMDSCNVGVKDTIDKTLMMQMEASMIGVELAAMQETLFWKNLNSLQEQISLTEKTKEK